MSSGLRRRLVLALLAACVIHFAAAQQQGCPRVSGFEFFRLQEVTGAYTINTVATTGSLSSMADVCRSQPRCNAFDTSGALQIVPLAPTFSVLDGNSTDVATCDGIYITRRTLTGLVLPAGENADTIRKAGAKTFQAMQAISTVVSKVSAQLKSKGHNPHDAASLPRDVMVQAFTDGKVPQAQSSDTAATYTYGDVLTALSYPVWDSRGANSTTYNYISPVKDQGSCGSCVAFAVTAAAETAVAAINGTIVNTNNFSEQWLFFCNGMYSPVCEQGWYSSAAANVIVSKNLPYEANYPYTGAPSCTLKTSPELRAGGNFSRTFYTDINAAKQHIRTYGSVSSYFAVYNDFFGWTATSKPYAWDGVSALAGYHQVLTIGYNDTGSFWIVKNSWGSGWGDKGFFRISYAANVGFMTASGDSILGLSWKPPAKPAPSPSPPPAPVCGDGFCAANETCASCPGDCGTCAACGDGVCSGGETCLTCKADCGVRLLNGTLTCCGDGMCNTAGGESCASCPGDCGACPTCNKNSICESALGEKCVNTTTGSGCSDCGTCGTSAYCGDGKCTSARKGYSETCGSCPSDCGRCSDPLYCGDGVCSSSRWETTSTCSRDCSRTKLVRIAPGVSDSDSIGNGNNGNGNGNGNSAARPGGRRALGISDQASR